jgi:hypothetical protein
MKPIFQKIVNLINPTPTPRLDMTTISLIDLLPTSVTVSWDAVANAESYDVHLDNVLIFSNITDTEVDLTNLSYDSPFTLLVTAKAIGYISSKTQTNFNTPARIALTTPSIINSTIEANDIEIEIDPVTNAEEYIWTLNGEVQYQGVETTYEFTGLTALTAYTIGIQAITTDTNYQASGILLTDFTTISNSKLSTPVVESQEVTFNSFTLTVAEVPNAEIYTFSLNGIELQSSASRTFTQLGLLEDTDYTITVVASADEIESSDPLNVVISTSALDGERIENYGAKPIYYPFYNQLLITPLPGESKTLITYTGLDDAFTGFDTTLEFLMFRNNLNPSSVPSNVVNQNFYPNTVTARYGRISDLVDGKNVKIDVLLN